MRLGPGKSITAASLSSAAADIGINLAINARLEMFPSLWSVSETPVASVYIEKVAIRSDDGCNITTSFRDPFSSLVFAAASSRHWTFPSHPGRTFGAALQTSFSSCAPSRLELRYQARYRMSWEAPCSCFVYLLE